MIRNIKVFALALGAMMAFSVVVAGAAQAGDNFKYGSSSGTIKGEQQGGNHIFTIAGGRSFECSSAIFTGTFTEEQPTTQKANASYENCLVDVLGENFPVTVNFTDCYYEFTHTGGSHVGHVFLRCPDTDQVHVSVFADASTGGHTELLCEYTLDEQGPLGAIAYANNAGSPSHVTVEADVSGISYTRTNNNGGALICGPSSGSATYVGDSTVKAKNTSGTAVSGEVV